MVSNEEQNLPGTSREAQDSLAGNSAEPSSDAALNARDEYMNSLRQWVEQARVWQNFCTGYPQYYTTQGQENTQSSPRTRTFWTRVYQLGNQSFATTFPYAEIPPEFDPARFATAFTRRTYEFTIPPLWKRFVAEFLDFIILFIIKLFLTFCVLESFNLMNFEHYGLEMLHKNFQNPKMAMQMSVEILVLEIVHRFVVCFYEAYWLKGGQCATPGKWYMGLMVVRADSVVSIPGRPENTVRVHPCTPLGLQKAFIRAIMKNLFIGLMLPICFALYVFRFNRTGYDIIASSLVVEWNHNLPFRPVN